MSSGAVLMELFLHIRYYFRFLLLSAGKIYFFRKSCNLFCTSAIRVSNSLDPDSQGLSCFV